MKAMPLSASAFITDSASPNSTYPTPLDLPERWSRISRMSRTLPAWAMYTGPGGGGSRVSSPYASLGLPGFEPLKTGCGDIFSRRPSADLTTPTLTPAPDPVR